MPTETPQIQNFEAMAAKGKEPEATRKKSGFNKTILIITGAVCLLLFSAVVLVSKFKINILPGGGGQTEEPVPTATPTPYQEIIASPSAYATDSAILQIQENIKALEIELKATDLKESNLTLPGLDLNVNFDNGR